MLGRGVSFTRWYDRTPELSQAVRMLEKSLPLHQRLIAGNIIGAMQLHEVAQRSEHGLKKLGTEKITGLMKAKGKRRWYDQDPVVHQAFNHMYLMEDAMRREYGIKIIVAIRALERAQSGHAPERVQNSLARAVFEKPLHLLLEQMEFVIEPSTGSEAVPGTSESPLAEAGAFASTVSPTAADPDGSPAGSSPEPPAPDFEPPAYRPAPEIGPPGSRIAASQDGMKIIHRLSLE